MSTDERFKPRLSDALREESRQFQPLDNSLFPLYAMSLWKCFVRPYLARSFDGAERATCFLHNYQYIIDHLSFEMVDRLRREDIILWKFDGYTISAKMEHVIGDEGEITLHFKEGTFPLYGLSFNFVPGKCVGVDRPHGILIARMQGRAHESARIAQATKSCGSITPQASLYCVLLGIAMAANIDCIASVSASNHLSYTEKIDDILVRAYDEFFETIVGSIRVNGFLISMLPAPIKPLEDIVRSHRRRTRIKRAAKAMIVDAARQNWRSLTSS